MSEGKLVTMDNLYGKLTDFIDEAKGNQTYDYLVNMLRSGHSELSLTEKFIRKDVDTHWLQAMEKCIVPLDEIIRKPNRFIRNDEDVVAIEKARGITVDSIRDLAQHSDYLGKDQDGELTPTKILNVTKEEAFDTYENRFIYTLIKKLIYFIDQRVEGLSQVKKDNSQLSYALSGEAKVGADTVKYEFRMTFETDVKSEEEIEELIHADVNDMSAMQRVNRLKSIIYTFAGSAFMKNLKNYAEVRPPLNMTNMLKKNPNFQACVELWNYIDSYVEKGYEVESVDRVDNPDEIYLNRLYSMIGMQYILLKKNSATNNPAIDVTERRQVIRPHIVSNTIDEVMDAFDLSLDEVQKIYVEQIASKKRREQFRFAKIREVIKRAITAEKVNLKNDAKYDDRLKKKGELNLAYAGLNYQFDKGNSPTVIDLTRQKARDDIEPKSHPVLNNSSSQIHTGIDELTDERGTSDPADGLQSRIINDKSNSVKQVEELPSLSSQEKENDAKETIDKNDSSVENNDENSIAEMTFEKKCIDKEKFGSLIPESMDRDPAKKEDKRRTPENLTAAIAPEKMNVSIQDLTKERESQTDLASTRLEGESSSDGEANADAIDSLSLHDILTQNLAEKENSMLEKNESPVEFTLTNSKQEAQNLDADENQEQPDEEDLSELKVGKDRREILLFQIQDLNNDKYFVQEESAKKDLPDSLATKN